jgi:hypothetical protein
MSMQNFLRHYFLKSGTDHTVICGATFQKNKDLDVSHVIIASVHAALTSVYKTWKAPISFTDNHC